MPKFEVRRFQIEGNTLLTESILQQVLDPFVGPDRDINDVNLAAEALRAAYRDAGYPIIRVFPAEQKVNGGLIRLRVLEGKLTSVTVTGNRLYDLENIRNSLPPLREGQSPNVRELVAAIATANENPAKQVAVNFQPGANAGDVVARIEVTEDRPEKFVVSYDNHGTQASGYDKVSVAYQNANLFNRDHLLTAQYATTIQHPSDVQNYSLGYRIPWYSAGLSLDLLATYSDSAGGGTVTPAGPLQFTGKGTILAARINQTLAGTGEIRHKIIYGLDYKNFDNDCALNGTSIGNCGTVTTQPASISYVAQMVLPNLQAGGNLTYVHNISGGRNGSAADYLAARAGAPRNWQAWRFGAYVGFPLSGDWQARGNYSMQETTNKLIQAEQFGIGGAASVRGYGERVLAGDKGNNLNLELYTPDFGAMAGDGAKMRGLFFVDWGAVRYNDFAIAGSAMLLSSGIGLRYGYGNLNVKMDWAWALSSHIDQTWRTTVRRLKDESDRSFGELHLSSSYTF